MTRYGWRLGLVLIALAYVTGCYAVAYGASPQWQSTNDYRDPKVLLWGSWQSCRENDATYTELAYHGLNDSWTFHFGPRDEFALYRGNGPTGDHDHGDAANLLGPDYRVNDNQTWRGKRNWNVPSLHLWISITQAGGSRDDCESFFVLVRKQ